MRFPKLFLIALFAVGLFTRTAYAQPSTPGLRNVSTLPSTCNPSGSNVVFKTTATIGPYYCNPANTWNSLTGGSVSPGFGTITTGTNTAATMTVGSGASLVRTGSGIIDANKILNTVLTTITGIVWMNAGVPGAVTLTTTGTSGPATFSAGTLNIPQYSGGGAGCATSGSNGQVLSDNGTGGCNSNSTGSGFLTWLATPTSANLASFMTTKTGTGLNVFGTSPTLITPSVTTINDANGNPFLTSTATASAVDSVTVTNAATANPATVTIGATGSDTNINLSLVGKGTGSVPVTNFQDKGGQVFNVLAYGVVAGDVDTAGANSTAMLALLATVNTAGGGTIYFPPGTYRFNSQLLFPNNAANPPIQNDICLIGAASTRDWAQHNPATAASQLDLRYNGNNGGKIETRGVGNACVQNLYIYDGGSENSYSVTGGTVTNIVVTSNVAVATLSAPPASGDYIGAVWAVTGSTTAALNGLYYLTAVSGSTITFAVNVANGTYNNGALTLHNSSPLLHATGTTLSVRESTFVGNSSLSEDAIVLGGTSTTTSGLINDAFQGYKTIIDSNHFEKLNRWVYERIFANSVTVIHNSGNVQSGTRALECDAFGAGGQPNVNNVFSDNTIEMTSYVYGIVLNACQSTVIENNGFYDQVSNVAFVSNVLFSDTLAASSGSVVRNDFDNGFAAVSFSNVNTQPLVTIDGTPGTAAGMCVNASTCPTGKFGGIFPYGLIVAGGFNASNNLPGGLAIQSTSSPGAQVTIDYNSANNYAIIDNYFWNGGAPQPLALNPSGGKVGIGSTTSAVGGTIDTCFSRNSAGVLNIENCAGTLVTARMLHIAVEGNTTTGAQGNGAKLQFSTGTTTTNDCVKFDANGNTVDAGAACGTGGASALSAITAATGTNTIASGNNGAQIWNWAQTSNNQSAFTIGETTAATNGTLGNQYGLKAVTLAGSTAVPMNVTGSLTGSQTLPALYITPTWNTSGKVVGALLLNVTNTASGANSALLNLQVGGTSQHVVDLAGLTYIGSNTVTDFWSTASGQGVLTVEGDNAGHSALVVQANSNGAVALNVINIGNTKNLLTIVDHDGSNNQARINPRNTCIGLGNSCTTLTLSIKDATASTGVTDTEMIEGAGQSTTEVFGIYANDGTTKRIDLTNNIFTVTSAFTSSSATNTFSALPGTSAGDIPMCKSTTNIMHTAAVTCGTSAARYKQAILPSQHGLDWLMKMKPVTFEYKPEYGVDGTTLGFIADDLNSIDPLFGAFDKDGLIENYRDRAVIATLVKAVQEQQAEINILNGKQ